VAHDRLEGEATIVFDDMHRLPELLEREMGPH
jgi:hypothetical protein